MDKGYVKLSDAVAKLLTDDNKDKNLGEVSQELNSYLIEIKELVESNEISYNKLRQEIQKHIDIGKNVRPGSVAQLLVGCVNEKECPLQKEKAVDISFIYDHKLDKIVPLTNITSPVSEDSYCVIYINGDPSSIKPEALLELEKMGFKRIKVRHKKPNASKYQTIDIADIQTMINENQGLTTRGTFIIAIFIVILVLLYLYK
jgi:vacuolar-type H+-ATPase subunit I/STV1